ncbi:hypothetical protein KVR01_009151 [Diaporthe batatas]|uniref:uncharacterized protein n=1 Tax=Diaporthe batatas TaxID=748121 RepID=UPI001D059CE0|nr:uncharacterized protein KVR01_009151 [Diaporthe batatas]KAG8160887.1 hypothetical protein KVR01_009151 [Diaporthe batatas]
MAKLTNYVAFLHPETGREQIGHLDLDSNTIQPLSFGSGTPVRDLYQVVEAGSPDKINAIGSPLPVSSVRILPPVSGRDVLAVGKNYMEHAKEFNSSGFDSSDKVDRPSHPVIFTKRSTSIIADGEEILLHEGFTSTADYEGEIGVIISRPGFRVSAQDAWDYVWGYTIINDVTARERQRDHKQFYIGKSPDTFCPMGPIAVPKEDLPKTLKIQTHVNGELRQNSSTDDLIFSIPELIETLSAGQTLQPGDILATGTPAGVGIGKTPPIYLKPGDEVAISVTGLGTLTNKVAQLDAINSTGERIGAASSFALINSDKATGRGNALSVVDGKSISYNKLGSGSNNIIFVHGLGGTKYYWTPLVSTLALADQATLHLYDFEGHGQTPTHPLSLLTVSSMANDLAGVFKAANASTTAPATLIAHSFGCLVALKFTLDNPSLVKKLVLIGPPPSPLPDAAAEATLARATLVRKSGMAAVVDAVVDAGTSDASKRNNPLAVAAVRMSLLGQDPEAYAKACHALADSKATTLSVEDIAVPTLIITGEDDKVSPPALCEQYKAKMKDSSLEVLPNVGHWHVFEHVNGVSHAVRAFL